jgi:hypothetical protein
MNAGAKRPTDVESPMWATVVHRVVVAATGDTVVLVVLVVLVVVTAVVLVLVVVDTVGTFVVAAGAAVGVGAAAWMVVVADAAVGIASTRAGRVDVVGAISPCASGSARQPTLTMTTTMTTSASEASRRERATSRV